VIQGLGRGTRFLLFLAGRDKQGEDRGAALGSGGRKRSRGRKGEIEASKGSAPARTEGSRRFCIDGRASSSLDREGG